MGVSLRQLALWLAPPKGCSRCVVSFSVVGGSHCKLGLVQNLDSGLDSWTGLWTDVWTGFWTDTAMGDDHFQP